MALGHPAGVAGGVGSETLIGGTGEGLEAERKHKVLQYIIHRLKAGASLREALDLRAKG